MNKIIVTGGCGYIGSHTIVELIQAGYEVVSVDNLINSDESVLLSIEKITGVKVKNYNLDLSNISSIDYLVQHEDQILGIIHFAALKAVGDSVKYPLRYYHNNVSSLMNVLHWIELKNIPNLIFSSSCTVYGETEKLPVDESASFKETSSPYGKTKQMCEEIILDTFSSWNNKQAISLRYFNPAGAHHSHLIGESPINAPQNLVPVITETAMGKRSAMTVFGTDYNTRDGSCIRDYIHVMDLAEAHVLALQYLITGKQQSKVDAYNLGIGEGVSVLEAIHAFELVSGIKLNYKLGEKRPGDLPAIYADLNKAKTNLLWSPKKTMEDIMLDAWQWEQKRNLNHDQ